MGTFCGDVVRILENGILFTAGRKTIARMVSDTASSLWRTKRRFGVHRVINVIPDVKALSIASNVIIMHGMAAWYG